MGDFRSASSFETFLVRITSENHGRRLDHVLTAHLHDQTRSQIQRLIRQDMAEVDGTTAQSNTIVHEGELIKFRIPEPSPVNLQPQDLPLSIIYDDRDVVVVNKPTGMVVHPAAGHKDGTLVNALLHHVPDISGVGGEKRPGIVHRLDKGPSG